MSINERCEAEKISSLVKQHVPKAKLVRQHEAELTFTLPFESMDTFSGQTRDLFVKVYVNIGATWTNLIFKASLVHFHCFL